MPVNVKIKAKTKTAIIKTILIIFFIKDVEFSVYWNLVYIFSYPEVYFTAI